MAASPLLPIVSLILIVVGLFLIRRLSKSEPEETFDRRDDPVLNDYLTALEEFVPEAEIEFDAEHDMLRLDKGESGILYLGNIRQQVSEIGRADQTAKIRDLIRLCVAGEEPDAETIRQGLGFRPRTAEEMSIRRISTGDDFESVTRLYGDIFVDLVVDLGPAMQGMTSDRLEVASLTEDAAFALAKQNLLSITPRTVEALWEELEAGIWAMRVVDDYSAARIITLWSELPHPIDSVGTLFIPNQGTVMMIEGRDPDLQHRMIRLGEELIAQQRNFSMHLFEKSRDGFLVLGETQTEKLAKSIAEFRAYEEQADVLPVQFEHTQTDIFVPRPMVLDGEEAAPGIPRIGAVFIGGGTIIPQVDVLIIADPDGDRVYEVDWQSAARILGADRLTPYPGLVPVRYEIKETVPGSIMAALRAAGTEKIFEKDSA